MDAQADDAEPRFTAATTSAGNPAPTPSPPALSAPSDLSALSQTSTPTYVVASLGLALVLLFVSVLLARRRSKARGDVVLLVGPSDAGKTAILSSLVHNQAPPTFASLQPNSAVYRPHPSPHKPKALRIVDVPGHPRIRGAFRDELPNAAAVVFVVNASTVSRNAAAVAEHLHQILHALTSLPPSRTPPALLILAHKTDLLTKPTTTTPSTTAPTRVQAILERELEKRRAAHARGVGVGVDERLGAGAGDEGDMEEMGGLECSGGKTFAFGEWEWEGGEVEFLGTWVAIGQRVSQDRDGEKAAGGEDGLAPLRAWLEDLP